MTMTREIYEALRKRISIITKTDAESKMGKSGLFPFPDPIYYFSNAGLNPGLNHYDEGYIDNVIHQMSTHNLWNICQRFYSFLSNYPDINQRLMA